ARSSRIRACSLLLSQIADVLDLAAEDLDRGADCRVLAGERDPAFGCRHPQLLLLLGDGGVRRSFLLDDLQRGAEPQRFLNRGLHRGARLQHDRRLPRALAESDLHAGAPRPSASSFATSSGDELAGARRTARNRATSNAWRGLDAFATSSCASCSSSKTRASCAESCCAASCASERTS